MANYKVKVLGVQGLNKKVYGAGDKVTDKNFPQGVAEELVKSGHLESLDKKNDAKKLKDAEAAVKDAEKAYSEAQKAVAGLEKSKGEEKDEKKLEKIAADLESATEELTKSEKELNGAKAALKKLQ